MTWLDEQPQDKVNTAIAELDRTNSCVKYSGGDDRFALWLALADRQCIRKVGLGIFDLVDYTWRDAYEAGDSPREAMREALENDEIGAAMLAELEGAE